MLRLAECVEGDEVVHSADIPGKKGEVVVKRAAKWCSWEVRKVSGYDLRGGLLYRLWGDACVMGPDENEVPNSGLTSPEQVNKPSALNSQRPEL